MRLAASLRYSLYGLIAALFASGAAWLVLRYGAPSPFGGSRWSAISMQVHGAAAMATLVLIGCAMALHTKKAWRERRNLASGIALSGTLLSIVVTGYLLYYLGEDTARSAASATHWLLGLAAPVVLAWHALTGQRSSANR